MSRVGWVGGGVGQVVHEDLVLNLVMQARVGSGIVVWGRFYRLFVPEYPWFLFVFHYEGGSGALALLLVCVGASENIPGTEDAPE